MINRHDVRVRRRVAQLHALGPFSLLHFVADIADGADVEVTLRRYADLPAHFIAEHGGRDMPERMFAIAGGRR